MSLADEFDPEDSGSRWVDLDQFLDGTYSPPEPSVGATREDGISSCIQEGGTPLLHSPQLAKPRSRYGRPKRCSTGAATSSTSTLKKQTQTASSTDSKDSASVPKSSKNNSTGDTSTPHGHGRDGRSDRTARSPTTTSNPRRNKRCMRHPRLGRQSARVGRAISRHVVHHSPTRSSVLSLGHPPKAVNRQNETYGYGARLAQ